MALDEARKFPKMKDPKKAVVLQIKFNKKNFAKYGVEVAQEEVAEATKKILDIINKRLYIKTVVIIEKYNQFGTLQMIIILQIGVFLHFMEAKTNIH